MTDRVLLTAVVAGTLAAFAFGLYGWLHHVVNLIPHQMRAFATPRQEEAFAVLEPIFEWLLSLPDDEYEQIDVAALVHSMRTAYRTVLDREYAAA